MEINIVNKINDEILKGVKEESQVAYIMVELRKLLDRKRGSGINKYKIIRFYCDWSVHTEKSNITPEIKEIMDKIDREIPLNYREDKSWQIYQHETMGFIYMKSLRDEMNVLFSEFNINLSLLKEANWKKFISLLVKILEEQPILNPNRNIKSFVFEPAAKHAVIWVVEFNDTRGTTRFGNMY